MTTLDEILEANRVAVEHLVAAAERCEPRFTEPRAPEKWSPSQITEHVARALDESTNMVAGSPTKFPALPSFIRPPVRGLLFNRTLKKDGFPKARTSGPFFGRVSVPDYARFQEIHVRHHTKQMPGVA